MTRRHGFSLVEVLLAIFIMGIGVIAVAALFPAGIAQQRRSVDDIMGPIVANNALAILRTKLRPEDFGTFEEFASGPLRPTIEGGWPWMRPGVATDDDTTGLDSSFGDERGWYDIFSQSAMQPPLHSTYEFAEWPGGYYPNSTLRGIPYNTQLYGSCESCAPPIMISQGERYYPMAQEDEFVAEVNTNIRKPQPQYVWDCVFRRFQGRILVAIFVYRVTAPGGGAVMYRMPDNTVNVNLPSLPYRLDLVTPGNLTGGWDAFGEDGIPGNFDDAFVQGTTPQTQVYDRAEFRVGPPVNDSWQEPRQWILDGNNNIHRVLSMTGDSLNVPIQVELVRPIPEVPTRDVDGVLIPALPTSYYIGPTDTNGNDLFDQEVVSIIFFIPAEVTVPDVGPALLTPVYVTVKEL